MGARLSLSLQSLMKLHDPIMAKPAGIVDFRAKLRRLLMVPIAALLLLGVLLSLGILELVRSARWVDHTDQVIAIANELQTLMIDEETGVRGFLLSHDPASLKPWDAAKAQIGTTFDQLAQLIRDNPAQEARLKNLRERHGVWQHSSEQQIAHLLSPNLQTASVLQDTQRMDELRGEVHELVETENQLRQSRSQVNARDLSLLLTSVGVLALGFGAGLAWWLFHRINSLNQSFKDQADCTHREQQWLQTTLRSIGDGVIATDGEGCVIFMNAEAERATGWTEEEAKGRPLAEVFRIVNEETRGEVESPVVKVQRTGAVCGLANHTILIRKDGSEIHIDDSGAPIRNAQGKIIGIALVFRDIGERRAAERALEASESQLTSFVDSIPTLAWMANADGWIFWYNRRWYEYTGTTPEQMQGWGWQSVHDPAILPSVLERWTASIQSGTLFEMVFPLRGADGVFRSFLTRVIPGEAEHGTVTRWFGTNTEIDELHRTREVLREKTELIDLAQSAVNAGYWSYHPATGECFLSPGEQVLFGFVGDAYPAVGEVIERIHEADRESVVTALENGMKSGNYFAEFRIYKQDGSLRWIAGQGRVLSKDDGEKYMVGINFDITNQKLSEEALRKSEKLAVAGRFAATISHEINNPLESVTNLLYILKTNITDEGSMELLTTAEEELGRVAQIVTQSLRFHRQSTVPTFEKVSTILESAAGIYKSRLGVAHIEIKRDYRDHNPVRCYSSELRQVFGNFIGNAFDAIRQGGTICLRTRDAVHPITGQPGVRITVADSGHGMDAKILQRITEPFFTTKGVNGTGLGLWISRDILKKHHGILRVRSRRGDGLSGTVFSVFLPLIAIMELTTAVLIEDA